MQLEHIEALDLSDFLAVQESQFVMPMSDWREDVIELVRYGDRQTGELLPWSKTHDKFRLRPSEVTLWAGINGHGKSLLVGQVMLWLKSKMVIASMEMPPPKTIRRMVSQAAGTEHPTVDFANHFMDTTDNIYLYDQLDSVEQERIIGLAHYAAKELGVKHVVIDNLAKCVKGTDDYSAQKEFVNRMCWAAKTHGIHVHIVHHIRKAKSEEDIPDKFDIKGAGEITDLVDNVVIVHRNKRKELMRASGEEIDDTTPDSRLIVAKQRHGGWEGRVNLWFIPFGDYGGQYVSRPNSGPMPWPSPDDQWRKA